jgi:beta-aspartyl-peptidase (threonine type)
LNVLPRILLHGGAGEWRIEARRRAHIEDSLREAVEAGLAKLNKGSALEGVVAALTCLEDSGLFNAGRGSYPNIENDIEVDAGLMDGSTLDTGAVAAVRNVRNPSKLSYIVLKQTKHVLLAGDGAERLAKAMGLWRRLEPSPEAAERARSRLKEHLKSEVWLTSLRRKYRFNLHDTVGCVALDGDGNLAAGTSTGGTPLKIPGRVGDSPIPGAGYYASNGLGAVSATGEGEDILKFCLSFRVSQDLSSSADPFKVLQRILEEMRRAFGRGTAGAVVLNPAGKGAFYATTNAIAVAWGTKRSVRSCMTEREELVRFNQMMRRDLGEG